MMKTVNSMNSIPIRFGTSHMMPHMVGCGDEIVPPAAPAKSLVVGVSPTAALQDLYSKTSTMSYKFNPSEHNLALGSQIAANLALALNNIVTAAKNIGVSSDQLSGIPVEPTYH